MYRDDDVAGAARANALIDEIAALEREQVAATERARRLEAARHELAELRTEPAAEPHAPGLLTHALVLAASGAAAFLAYTLLS